MELAQVREFFGKYVQISYNDKIYWGTLSAGDEPKNDVVILSYPTQDGFTIMSDKIELILSDIKSVESVNAFPTLCQQPYIQVNPYVITDYPWIYQPTYYQPSTYYQPYVYTTQLTPIDVINIPQQQLMTINSNYNGTAYANNQNFIGQAISGDLTMSYQPPTVQSILGDAGGYYNLSNQLNNK